MIAMAARKSGFIFGLVALLSIAACKESGSDEAAKGGGRGPGGTGGRGGRAFPVQTQPVGGRDVSYVLSAVGSIEAFEEIQVTSRVTGVVEKVSFAEGETVKANQPLAEIEPRRFELAVETARAALARSKAAQDEAEAGLARREKATEDNPGLIPGEEIETWRTRVATAKAEARSAEVALDRAALDRRDAFVRAPVAGVLQSRTVKTGQYVQPGTVLATLIQRDPLLLRFDVPERDAAALHPGMPVEFGGPAREKPFQAEIKLVTTAADPSTRMVKVTAEVTDSRKSDLRAGSFARVSVKMGQSSGAVVIPQTAVRPSEKGFLTYVVENGAAVERVVELGMHTGDGMIEVKGGLEVGEQLVVRGGEALRNGAKVVIDPEGASRAGGGRGKPAQPVGEASAGGSPVGPAAGRP